jgi:hypothetical protein
MRVSDMRAVVGLPLRIAAGHEKLLAAVVAEQTRICCACDPVVEIEVTDVLHIVLQHDPKCPVMVAKNTPKERRS